MMRWISTRKSTQVHCLHFGMHSELLVNDLICSENSINACIIVILI